MSKPKKSGVSAAVATTVAPVQMSYERVLLGTTGHVAQGFARATMASQLAFWYGRAVVRDSSPARDIPVFDASIIEAMGDNGLPQVQALDQNVINSGYAAAFLLLSSHIKTPHPENGRKEEHLLRFLKSPRQIVTEAVDFGTSRQIQQTQAAAEMMKADPTKRIEVLKAEATKRVETVVGPVIINFTNALKGLRNKDAAELVDIACLALVECGRDPGKEIQQSAVKFIESQKKRLEDGQFVSIDAGIYALAK